MSWKDIASGISKIAPGLGAAIGGPPGAIVGMGVKALCSVFGIDSEAEDAKEQMAKAIEQMTPAQALEMQRMDKQFIVDMEKLKIDVYKLEVADRSSARIRESKMGSFDNRILAYMIVAGFIGVVYAVLFADDFKSMDSMQASMVGTLVGYLSAKAEQVVGYYFGSSKGSADKTNALAEAAKGGR